MRFDSLNVDARSNNTSTSSSKGGVKNIALWARVLALNEAAIHSPELGYERREPSLPQQWRPTIGPGSTSAAWSAMMEVDNKAVPLPIAAGVGSPGSFRRRRPGGATAPGTPSDYIYEILGRRWRKRASYVRHLRIDDDHATGWPSPDGIFFSLVVHVSDLTRRVLVRLPWDYADYGRAADDERVIDAVQASMSIPFYFSRRVKLRTEGGP